MHRPDIAAMFRRDEWSRVVAKQRTEKATKGESESRLPSAKELLQKIAAEQAEKAAEALRRDQAAADEKKALIDRLSKPSGLSDDEISRRANVIIQRAVNSGHTSVQVYRFPNQLCTDRGRAINQNEPGWENTLTGIPKEIYGYCQRCLRTLGYKLRCEVVDFPGGMPGDIGISLSWE